MLKQRVITALILIPLVFAALWYLPTEWMAVLVGLLMLACVNEWHRFLPQQSSASKWAYLGLAAAGLVVLHPMLWGAQLGLYALALGLIWWAGAALWLQRYPRGFEPSAATQLLRAAIGLAAVLPCYVALWQLHAMEQGRELIILLLFLVWATDTGGYFAGKRFGHYKLARQISPNKTWEGLLGGVALALALALAGGHWVFHFDWVLSVVLGLAVSLVSIVGDLTISMFKRQCGIKDTGNLFPGHGGALDRLDSMLSAAPMMLAICLFWAIA